MTNDYPAPKRRSSIFHLTRTTAKVLFSLFFKIRADGLKYLPKQGAFILVPKHQRWEDIPLLSLATPRPLFYAAKYELFLNPVSRWFLSALGGIPLNRARPLESRQSFKDMIEVLRNGEGLVIFPEGTYYKNEMGPGHLGLFKLVLSRFTLPFIPVGISYLGQGVRTLVRIKFGRAVYEGTSANADSFTKQVMKEIARLSGL